MCEHLHQNLLSHYNREVIGLNSNQDKGVALVRKVKEKAPNVRVLVRAYERAQFYRMKDAGADWIVSDTYHSALQLGEQGLIELGMRPNDAQLRKEIFKSLDEEKRDEMFDSWRNHEETHSFTAHYRQLFMDFQELMGEAMQGKNQK